MDVLNRFTDRVENYVKYRPGYPEKLLDYLISENILDPAAPVADVGSGTGIFSRLLLSRVDRVYGIEPNDAMREAAEKDLAVEEGFVSVKGTSEATGLPAGSVGCITCAQAFHWFDRIAAREEFYRIGRENTHAVIIWNSRKRDQSAFDRDFEAMLQEYGTDYNTLSNRTTTEEEWREFYRIDGYRKVLLDNCQYLDREGLTGRVLSASYVPGRGQPGHEEIIQKTGELFDRYNENGTVRIDYEVKVFTGRVR